MKNIYKASYILWSFMIILSCDNQKVSHEIYTSVSSLTQLTDHEEMLKVLPDDPAAIAKIASKQMIHHNNLQSFNIPKGDQDIWTPFPPNFTNILGTLDTIEPYDLSINRTPENRLIGACVSESYFLAGLLRYKNIPVRIRAGYFKNINKYPEKHAEYPQDGRSHIRSQLVVDFYNLLNHDISCYSNINLPSKEFVKQKTYEELSNQELSELDALANLLSKNPSTNQLINFYNESKTLKIRSAQMDPFSFVKLEKEQEKSFLSQKTSRI